MDHTKLDEIEKEILQSQIKIDTIKNDLKTFKESNIPILYTNEQPNLDKRYKHVIYTLITCILISSLIIGFGLIYKINLYWICSAAGIMGSSIAALKSCLDRRANGIEFNNGTKYPSDKPADKFSMRISTYFMLRPLLGLFAGLVVYFGLHFLFKSDSDLTGQNGYIFWSLLAGLFAKTLLRKLKNLFEALIGQ